MYYSLLPVLGRGLDVHGGQVLLGLLEDSAAARACPKLQQVLEHIGRGQVAQAQYHLDRAATDLKPDQAPAQLARAILLLYQDQSSRAAACLEQLRTLRPGQAQTAYVLGICYEQMGRWDQAIQCYQDSLKLRANLRPPLLRLAAIRLHQAQLEPAIEAYAALKALDPYDMLTAVLLGQMYTAAGQHPLACSTLEQAILLNPGAMAWKDPTVEDLIERGHYAQALSRLDHQMAGQARPELLAKRGQILLHLDQLEEAIAAYLPAVTACPSYLEAYVHLATAYATIGHTEAAADAYLAALVANELHIQAYVALARSYNQAGHLETAMDTLVAARALLANSTTLLIAAAQQIHAQLNPHNPTQHSELARGLASATVPTSRISAGLDLYLRSLILWPSLGPSQIGQILQRSGEDESDFLVQLSTLKTLLRQDQASSLNQHPSWDQQLVSTAYQAAVLASSRYRFAGSILNLATALRSWPTGQIWAILGLIGIIEWKTVYRHWLDAAVGLIASNAT